MTTTPTRLFAATCLVATALLSTISVLLQPEFAADPAERLAAMDASGTPGVVSLLAFVLTQLPFLVAVVTTAVLARTGSSRLATTGGALAVIGGFGHAVFGGVGLTYLAMSSDVADRAALAEVVTRVESGPAVGFMAAGMLGTVIGLLLLGIALFRSRVVARWVPAALWAFLLVEFVLSNVTEWAAPLAAVLYLGAFVGIAATLVRGETPAPTTSDRTGDAISVRS